MALPILVLLFILTPLVELAVILSVGDALGVLPTVGLLLAFSVLGGWLARREGTGAWRRLQAALAERRAPADEVADGALILLAGALLVTPGFVTDLLGLTLLIPFTRRMVRRVITAWIARRAQRGFPVGAGFGPGSRAGFGGRTDGFGFEPPPDGRSRFVDGQAADGPARTITTWGAPEPDTPPQLRPGGSNPPEDPPEHRP